MKLETRGCAAVTKGIRHLKRPQTVVIQIDAQTQLSSLAVVSCEGKNYALPISNGVAEVLIARGMSYGS